MSDYFSNIQLQEILARLIAEKRSGTFVINSACNHVITIAIDNGRIVALFYGPKRGRPAIPLISRITGGSYRFEDSTFSLNAQDLPSTAGIMIALQGGPGLDVEDFSSPKVGHTQAGQISSAHAQQIYQGLEEILVQYLGPIASMVLEDVCQASERSSKGPEEFGKLITCLLDEIEDEEKALRFKREANQLLADLLPR